MRAIEMRIDAHGGPERLAPVAVALPPPGEGQVLLRQTAVGVNFIDTYHRRGVFPIPALPGAIGVEAAGIVEAAGPGVALRPGGLHIMLVGLAQAARPGTTVPLTLQFERAGSITLELPVQAAGAAAPGAPAHRH